MLISPLLQSINQRIVAWLIVVDGGVVVIVAADRQSRFPLAAGRGGRTVALAPDPPVSPPIARPWRCYILEGLLTSVEGARTSPNAVASRAFI